MLPSCFSTLAWIYGWLYITGTTVLMILTYSVIYILLQKCRVYFDTINQLSMTHCGIIRKPISLFAKTRPECE